MRMMLNVTFPTPKFNELARQGQVGVKLKQILDEIKPEAVYFGRGVANGSRGCVAIVDVSTPADLPRVTEPWYLAFDATVETTVCMTPEEVGKLDMEAYARTFG